MKITPSVAWVVATSVVAIIVCMTVIMVTGHDVTIFAIAVGLILTSGAGFIAVFVNQKKQAETLQTVKGQTNGTLSRLLDSYERAVARQAVFASEATPETVRSVMEHTMTPTDIADMRSTLSE